MNKYIRLFLIIFLLATFSHAENFTTVSKDFRFNGDLGFGFRGQDVMNLQCILEIGTPTGYFGPITKQAVIDLQNNHKDVILAPVGLSVGTGFVGSSTRAFLNAQLVEHGAVNPSCPTYSASEPNPQPVPQPYPPPNPNPIPNQNPIPQPTQNSQPSSTTCPPGYSCVSNQQNQYGGLPIIPTLNNPYSNPYSTNPYSNPYSSTDPYNSFSPQGFDDNNFSSSATNLPQANGDIAGLRRAGQTNISRQFTEQLAGITVDHYGAIFVGGIATQFGGIGDRDVDPRTGHDYSYDPLPVYPNCNARGLDPNSNYMAFRWDYDSSGTPVSYLLTRYAEFYNPATNLYTLAKPVDYGPSQRTGASVDVSRGVLRNLGAVSGSKLYFRLVPATGTLSFGCTKVSR